MEQGQPTQFGRVAERLAGAMVAVEPPKPLDVAVAYTHDGQPLYAIVVCFGSENIRQLRAALELVEPDLKPVTMDDFPDKVP